MKKIILLLSIAFSVFLTGCATTAGYEKILNTWLGETEDHLIQKWGVPNAVYDNGNKRYLVYIYQNAVYLPGTAPTYYSSYDSITRTVTTTPVGGYSGKTINFYCKTTYTIDNGVITYWQWQGNGCTAYE